MRIGITGATGLIGKAFAKLATGSGHEVVAYSRGNATLAHAAETLQMPKEAAHKLPETRLDALVHLAGESLMGLWTPGKRERMWNSRVELTGHLMEHVNNGWAPANRPQAVLAASGIGFYGSRGDTELDESSPRGEGFLAELCEKWEDSACKASAWGARVVHLRTSMVLAQDGGAYPLMSRAFRYGLGGQMGNGRQWMSWIHVEDEAAMMLWALENDSVNGPLNLCAPAPELNSNFTRKLAASLKRPAFMHVPALALRLLLPGMANEMLLCSQRALPGKATDLGYHFAHTTLDEALVALK
ncbi:TIGR01777 family oxidoreductase [Prosthecobacter sp. SYSU 5D2]|uniref:TIGR01777 family oxidoreductase n=1 Tax=Prosthecobacter sp. SYSU 5D2 TaxID=3134134 RepID=UPI0031FE9C88